MTVLNNDKEKMDSVIGKIQKALALANDNNTQAEESDTAMLMAQRLMAKYNISMSDIEVEEEKKDVVEGDGTEYTRLQWWMKDLSSIIGENFRCYNYMRTSRGKRKIVFLGLEQDVQICKTVYDFALNAIKFHSDKYVKSKGIKGDRGHTIAVKNDYIAGYLEGLREKFREQVEQEGWGLILVKDNEVIERFEDMGVKNETGGTRSTGGDQEAREKGYQDGKKFSHGRKQIGG